MPVEYLVGLVLIVALTFDFVNGFHDASNSIATIVATRVLTPRQAVAWAAFFNVMAAFVFNTGVAATVGNGLIDLGHVTLPVILSGLLAATLWGLITWRFGMPSSSSHALIGGYAGAALMGYAQTAGWDHATDILIAHGWYRTLMFIILAPLIGMSLGGMLQEMVHYLFKNKTHEKQDKIFGRVQLLSSAFLSLSHGGNDAQKTAGVIAGALVTAGYFDHFEVPLWVLFCCYGVIGLGTLFGGWRIVETMGHQLTRLRPMSGVCAETAAATSIMLATLLHLPVSTTQATTGAILGTGAARNVKAVRWYVAGRIVIAWILTIPMAGLLGAGFVFVFKRLLESPALPV
jgi:PiT family inorganic phosphate transporter